MVTPTPSLAGVWAKIERADEHIQNLNSEITALTKGDTYRIVSEVNADATKCSVRIVGPEPPLRLSTIVGDIVHNLRSSLDLLVSNLALKNGKAITKQHQFPICDTLKKFEDPRNGQKIKGLSANAQDAIEARQPYRNSKGIKVNFLYVLRELNNADKHRTLIAASALADAKTFRFNIARDVTMESLSPPKGPQRPTEEGVELYEFTFGEPQPDIKINADPIVNIVFSDPGVMPEQPVVYILRQLSVKTFQLVRSFEEMEFK